MSTTASRLISASAASWAKIGVTMIAQMALIPLYLTHWSVETYGIWIGIQALVSVLSTLDFGHQTFLGFEFLKLGKNDREKLATYLWSGVGIGICLALIQILVIGILLFSGLLPSLLGGKTLKDPSMIHDAGIVLLLQGLNWMVSTSISGLFVRALAPFGYYPRMSWWGLVYAIISTVAPVTAVMLGAELLTTGIVDASASMLYSILLYTDTFGLLRKEKIAFTTPSWKLGLDNFIHSLVLTARTFLENMRQQGVRLVLAPLSGATALAAFSTMRTGANVALQGLNTVTNPLMPELMTFLHKRDQERSEAAFGSVWIVVVVIMAPAVVILQMFIEPLYTIWTHGSIPFNPLLFALFSLGVLVYAVAQPAISVVAGNNLLKPQLVITGIAAIIVTGGIFLLVPHIGILGGGIALVVAELAATSAYRSVARRWLRNNGLTWPKKAAGIAAGSVFIAGAAMFLMIQFSQVKWLILAVSLLMLFLNMVRYWKALPVIATQRVIKLLSKLPVLNKFFKS